jgi:hypothetical protein
VDTSPDSENEKDTKNLRKDWSNFG